MPTIRRNDLSPRVELLPLIDVIFLLLTFFIYSMVVMVHARVLPLQLIPLGRSDAVKNRRIQVVTIDANGHYYLNQQLVDVPQLQQQLLELSLDPDQPTLYVAIGADGHVDRSVHLVELVQYIQAAGLANIAFVGTSPTGANR